MKWKSRQAAAATLLVTQTVLAASVAAKYAFDRATRPRVWARAAPYDPERPLRGRYLALQVLADGCEAEHNPSGGAMTYRNGKPIPVRFFRGVLVARSGVLTLLHKRARPDELVSAEVAEGEDCHRIRIDAPLDFFVSEHAVSPRLKTGEELWVEVTVPSSGPPRPIQLAVSSAQGFHVLSLH